MLARYSEYALTHKTRFGGFYFYKKSPERRCLSGDDALEHLHAVCELLGHFAETSLQVSTKVALLRSDLIPDDGHLCFDLQPVAAFKAVFIGDGERMFFLEVFKELVDRVGFFGPEQ